MLRQAPASTATSATSRSTRYGLGFHLTLLYLTLEYGRPQELIPGFGELRLPALLTILLIVALLFSGAVDLAIRPTQLFLALLVLMAAHVPFAHNNYWAYLITRGMLQTSVVYLALVTFVDSRPKFHILVNAWLGIHVYLAITGISKGGKGIGGFLGDENDFSLALNMVIPFSFFLALEARTRAKRILFFAITGLFLAANVLTSSRGGFVGLLAIGLHGWLRSPHKMRSTLSVVALASTLLLMSPDTYWQEMGTILDEPDNLQGTGHGRIYAWTAGWKMFLEHPLVGVGPGNFPWKFGSYEPPEGRFGRFHSGRAAHSLYFTLVPELGIIGTILFLWMLISNLRALRAVRQPPPSRSNHPAAYHSGAYTLALEGSIVGFLVSGTFLSVLYYPCFWIWMGMVAAFTGTTRERPFPSVDPRCPNGSPPR